jgi:hypothetical protein
MFKGKTKCDKRAYNYTSKVGVNICKYFLEKSGDSRAKKQKRARIEIQPCFNPIFYEKPFI